MSGGYVDLMDEWSVELPKTWAAWLAEDTGLREILEEELSDNAEEIVAHAPSQDGWPEEAEAFLSDRAMSADTLTAAVAIHYTEVIPSGCKDMPHCNRCDIRVIVRLYSASPRAELEFSPGEPKGWELDERNSAADGC